MAEFVMSALHTLPYGIFYEPYATRIVVIAILDLRQSPGKIQRRLGR